jgi:hypothetical protein
MAQKSEREGVLPANWRTRMDLTTIVAVSALALSALSFYRSYLYIKQQLDVTVTEVSYITNQGELYMTIAFANSGNRDAALLRAEPALWTDHAKARPTWQPLVRRVHSDIPTTSPKTPLIIKAGGVEVVTLSTLLEAADAERALISPEGGAFLGVRIATMNSDGNLYLLEQPVARLVLDRHGRIQRAEPTIHQTLSGFADLQSGPPGDSLQMNKKTPFVWAEEHY